MTSLETLEGIWRSRPGGLSFAFYADRLHAEGRREQAAEVLAEGVRRWPRSLAGRLVQGRIALESGDVEGARAAYHAAQELDGSCRAALAGLAEASSRGQYFRQALDAWTRLAAIEPDHPRARTEMRNAAQQLDAPGGLSASAMVREVEDPRSREALSEGATSHLATVSQPTIPAFRLDLGESLATPSGFPHMDAPTIPELPGFQAPGALPGGSQTLVGKSGESSFATLEMPSFPARTIPPPPLEMPQAAAPAPAPLDFLAPIQPAPAPAEPPANIELPTPPRFPSPEEMHDAEATQFLAARAPVEQPRSRVTGDDIENRLDEVFGATTSVVPAMPPLSSAGPASSAPPATVASVPREGVTGDDVENRLGELFGETSRFPADPPTPAAAPVPPPPPAPRVAEQATAEMLPVVSGEDIEGRLDDLFGESVIDLTSPIEAKKAAETSAVPVEDILPTQTPGTDTAAVGRDTAFERRLAGQPGKLADSTTELRAADFRLGASQLLDAAMKGSEIDPGGSTIDLPTIEMPSQPESAKATRLTAEDVDSRLDELFASSEFLAEPVNPGARTGFVAKGAALPGGQVTGEDIEGRLDDLFGGDSDFPVGLPTVTFAEEYLRQGHKDKAANIYRQLLEKDPGNADLVRRLAEIEGRS